MLERFLANFGLNLLQGNDPITAGKNASVSTVTGDLFDKGLQSFQLGSEIANQGVQNAEYVNPALSSTANAGAGYTGDVSMMQSNLGRVGELTPPPVNPNMTARSMYPFQENPAFSQPQVPTADLGAFDIATMNNTQFPDYTAQAGTSDLFTGGGAEQPQSLLSKVYDKGVNMIEGVDAGDIAGGGLLYMNKLDQDQKHKDMIQAQQQAYMSKGISRNTAQKERPSQMLKVKIT